MLNLILSLALAPDGMSKRKRRSNKTRMVVLVFTIVVVVGFVAPSLMYMLVGGGGGGGKGEAPIPEGVPRFKLYSIAFRNGGEIPANYTCNGADYSPPLKWEGQPNGTAAYALIMEDLDAPHGVFTHWLIYDIPGWFNRLPAGIPRLGIVMGIGMQGVNDFGRVGYDGPCPPPGSKHRYRFVLYALGESLQLKEAAGKARFLAATQGKVIGAAELVGVYGRGG